jgi:hypothetical protein
VIWGIGGRGEQATGESEAEVEDWRMRKRLDEDTFLQKGPQKITFKQFNQFSIFYLRQMNFVYIIKVSAT